MHSSGDPNLRGRRIRVRIGTTLSGEFYPVEGVPTGGVLPVTCFGLKIHELSSRIARDIFRALFVHDLAICFRGRSLDTIERHLQQAVNAIQEWATENGFRFAAHKCKVVHFTAPRTRVQRPLNIRIGNTPLPVEESTKFLGLWWDSHPSFKKHIRVLKTECKEAHNLIRVVAHLKWGGDMSMHYYLKTRACTDNPAYHALLEFDPTIRDLYLPRPNGRGGMTRPSTQPIGLKLEEAMTSAGIDVELVCPLRTLLCPLCPCRPYRMPLCPLCPCRPYRMPLCPLCPCRPLCPRTVVLVTPKLQKRNTKREIRKSLRRNHVQREYLTALTQM